MNFDMSVWQTPLMVLVAGIVVGVVVLARQSTDKDQVEADGRKRDLQREHDAAHREDASIDPTA